MARSDFSAAICEAEAEIGSLLRGRGGTIGGLGGTIGRSLGGCGIGVGLIHHRLVFGTHPGARRQSGDSCGQHPHAKPSC